VDWDEVERCARTGEKDALTFTTDDTLARVAERGELFAPLLKLKQKLPKLS
jgi:bifunctional non-homologous end joining protein LigD